ncbi:MAG: 3-hydroxyacyl-CoA dehydrogenase family protein [Bacteroidetes bacterium]|nr:3-hydroxyacyl-CoA dehydrogenase family protein [Bacteroidota bacterium]
METADMKVETTGIIGEGKMGTNLAHYIIESGIEIRWLVSPLADLPKISRSIEKKIRRLYENGIITDDKYDKLRNSRASYDIKVLADCSLVIEAVAEETGLKKRVLNETDSILQADAILVSNSSSINPSVLCPSKAREKNFAGLHFFYPVNLVNIVEIVRGPGTSGETVDRLTAFLDIIKRRFIILEEEEGFILNRIFLDVQNEAYRIVGQAKASCADIDQAVKGKLLPSGIFEFFDHVGLDIMLVSIRNYTARYPHADYYTPLISKLEELTSEGHLGRKSGRGFFDYTGNETFIKSASANPEELEEIRNHLEFTYKNAARRFITHSGLTIDELNEALKEYFGTEQGPFE